MKIKPLGNKIVIKLDELPDEIITKSGIIIPDVNKTKQMNVQTGVVQSVGPGIKNQQGTYNVPFVKPGDWIVFNHHALFKCSIESADADDFLYLNENDVVAIIERD